MGYASLLEDIIQRLSSDLGMIKAEIESTKVPTAKQKEHVKALLNRCEGILNQLLTHATDPKLDITFGALTLKEENKKLREQMKSKDALVKKLRREASEMEGQIIELGRANKILRKELDFAQNPDKYYDKYSQPEMIQNYK